MRVPDILGGCPVAIVREYAFNQNDALRAVLFPETVRKMEGWVVYECGSLEAAFLPASVEQFHPQAVLSCGEAMVYAPEGSLVWEELNSEDQFAAWNPGAEGAWFK